MDGLQAEPEPVAPVEVLIGAGEDDQALALGEVEELGDVAEVELRQVGQRGPEDEAEAAAGRGPLAERPDGASAAGGGRAVDDGGLTTATTWKGLSRLRRRIMVRSASRSRSMPWRKTTSRSPSTAVTAMHDQEERGEDPALAVVAAAGPAIERRG